MALHSSFSIGGGACSSSPAAIDPQRPALQKEGRAHIRSHSVFLYRKRERTSGNTNDDYETIAVLGPNEDTYFDTSINVKAGYKYKEVIELGVAAQITLHFPQTDKYCGESSMLYFENPEQWLDFPNYGARILLSEQP